VVDNLFWCQVNYLVLNKLFGVPSINVGDENIYFGATTILFGGALNGCLCKILDSTLQHKQHILEQRSAGVQGVCPA
jgi:hypothetical protein